MYTLLLTFFTAGAHEAWWTDAFSLNMVADASIQAVGTVLVTRRAPFLGRTSWEVGKRQTDNYCLNAQEATALMKLGRSGSGHCLECHDGRKAGQKHKIIK